ncbi:unnamed protein product [marine sediment metagenome]|uniref:Uncharacterized protein n=1 Tax=marine sediment metagenome TaxID=412755 RepID=X1IGW9_9ZZZZ
MWISRSRFFSFTHGRLLSLSLTGLFNEFGIKTQATIKAGINIMVAGNKRLNPKISTPEIIDTPIIIEMDRALAICVFRCREAVLNL